MLTSGGFEQVYNLKGGIAAWQGHVAAGPGEMGMMLLKGDERPQDVIRLSYGLEEGLQKFYSTSAGLASDPKVAGILTKLAEIEGRHKHKLFNLYLTFEPAAQNIEAFEAGINSELMEGGGHPDKLLEQNECTFKTAAELLNLAMMLEAQAMDLYLRYADESATHEVKEVFFKIADEEKSHLKSLGYILEQNPE